MSKRRRNPTRRPIGTYCPACRARVYQVLCHDAVVRWITHTGELQCRYAFGLRPAS